MASQPSRPLAGKKGWDRGQDSRVTSTTVGDEHAVGDDADGYRSMLDTWWLIARNSTTATCNWQAETAQLVGVVSSLRSS